MRIPRRLSMTGRSEFSRVRAQGDSKGGRYLVLATLPCEELDHLKTGYITSRKVGKAVVRNRIRRRLRAIVSKHGDAIVGPRYLVMIARHTAGRASFAELERDWLILARKLGVVPREE